MKKFEVTVNGKTYPCYPTMGALLRFKKEAGVEITEVGESLSSMCVYLWCCVKSACNREKVAFDYTLEDFADNIDQDILTEWALAVSTPVSESDGEKKS